MWMIWRADEEIQKLTSEVGCCFEAQAALQVPCYDHRDPHDFQLESRANPQYHCGFLDHQRQHCMCWYISTFPHHTWYNCPAHCRSHPDSLHQRALLAASPSLTSRMRQDETHNQHFGVPFPHLLSASHHLPHWLLPQNLLLHMENFHRISAAMESKLYHWSNQTISNTFHFVFFEKRRRHTFPLFFLQGLSITVDNINHSSPWLLWP